MLEFFWYGHLASDTSMLHVFPRSVALAIFSASEVLLPELLALRALERPILRPALPANTCFSCIYFSLPPIVNSKMLRFICSRQGRFGYLKDTGPARGGPIWLWLVDRGVVARVK